MKTDKAQKSGLLRSLRIMLIILLLSIVTFFTMVLISPESIELRRFLVGFGVYFAGIVAFACLIKFLFDFSKSFLR
jgi:hypothetical protein